MAHARLGVVMVAAALLGAAPVHAQARVRPGLEVLLDDSLHLVRGKRLGYVSNRTGVDRRGVSGVERLRAAGLDLVALFSPEHGFRGSAAPGEAVASSTDSATGLPIYSLYGRVSAPTAEMLRGIDVMLVDLQDAGARYFTYLATAVGVIRSATAAGIPVLVLDRPNPIGGAVQGNVLDTAWASSVGLIAIPMRHGMTLGELTLLARHDLRLGGTVTVIPAAGWRRPMEFDRTGLPFVPPSPNLPSLASLRHYPGTCLFEGTALSVGRGTDAPFEQVGAPWLDTVAVVTALRGAALAGVRFRAAAFVPRAPGDGKFADTLVAGIRLEVTDPARYDPVRTAVTMLRVILDRHPDRFGWRERHFDRLAGGPWLRRGLLSGRPPAGLMADWAGQLRRFRARRVPYLLY